MNVSSEANVNSAVPCTASLLSSPALHNHLVSRLGVVSVVHQIGAYQSYAIRPPRRDTCCRLALGAVPSTARQVVYNGAQLNRLPTDRSFTLCPHPLLKLPEMSPSLRIKCLVANDVRFPTSLQGDGSDAMVCKTVSVNSQQEGMPLLYFT